MLYPIIYSTARSVGVSRAGKGKGTQSVHVIGAVVQAQAEHAHNFGAAARWRASATAKVATEEVNRLYVCSSAAASADLGGYVPAAGAGLGAITGSSRAIAGALGGGGGSALSVRACSAIRRGDGREQTGGIVIVVVGDAIKYGKLIEWSVRLSLGIISEGIVEDIYK